MRPGRAGREETRPPGPAGAWPGGAGWVVLLAAVRRAGVGQDSSENVEADVGRTAATEHQVVVGHRRAVLGVAAEVVPARHGVTEPPHAPLAVNPLLLERAEEGVEGRGL